MSRIAEDPSKRGAGAGDDPPAESGGFPTRGPDSEPMRKDLCPSVSSIEPSRPCGPTWAGRCLEIDSTLPIVRDRVRSAVPRPCPVASPRGEAGPPSVHRRAPGAGRAFSWGRNTSDRDDRGPPARPSRIVRRTGPESRGGLLGSGDRGPSRHIRHWPARRGGVLLGTWSAGRDGHPSIALVRAPGHRAGPGYGG